MDKQELRKQIAIIKRTTPKEILELNSKTILLKLEETDAFKQARCIALYHALSDEVQTISLINKWFEKKEIVLPVIYGDNMDFYPYEGKNSVKTGTLGILEPTSTKRIDPDKIDLFIVPGVAFDKNKNRMGRGKGFYDRYLAQTKAPTIGLCFGFQLLENIPAEPYDKKMTMIISENFIVS